MGVDPFALMKAREQAARERLLKRYEASPDQAAFDAREDAWEREVAAQRAARAVGRISERDLRRAVCELRECPRWALQLVCLARPVTLAELLEAARADGDEPTARAIAAARGWAQEAA